MKVLFAVSNEEISESIVKRYQKNYKEIISYKNVYYFNAILKELQKEKNYDRIVISEDLEAFTNAQYTQIDKFIFEKLDNISDEALNLKGDDIPIILICSDRREKSEEMLVKIFGIGIYNALLGNDRSVENVCNLLNKPRGKKDAKSYYKIDSEDVSYQVENENDVSEIEIQNILAHYKRLGKDEKRYVDSFDNIASQYNDVQLRIICRFLPLNVRAVLEEKSPRYQQIISYNAKVSDTLRTQKYVGKNETSKKEEKTSEKLLNNNGKLLSKPVVIPSSVNMSNGVKLAKPKKITEEISVEPKKEIKEIRKIGPMFEEDTNKQYGVNNVKQDEKNIDEMFDEKVDEANVEMEENIIEKPKRGRGRPRKNPVPDENLVEKPKRGRGRPRKNPVIEQQEEMVLPELEENKNDDMILPGFEEIEQEDTILPGFEEIEQEDTILPGFEEVEQEDTILPGFEEVEQEDIVLPEVEDDKEQHEESISNHGMSVYENKVQNVENKYEDIDISNLLTSDKKVACFLGTSKNGTSFIVNNLAQITSQMGIDTAILDTTKNKNSYYIYTENDEDLRITATECIDNLLQGVSKGIEVKKNLTVYTSLPNASEGIEETGKILQTLLKKHSLVLIDCDFKTPVEYFKKAQEIYLVQTYDILTIQPLTAFLKELKVKNILKEDKLRIVLNKSLKVRGVNEKLIIGGMAYYNDPAMSVMAELFDKNTIKYITVPFNEDVYAKYMESVIQCNISIKGYPKNIIQILNSLANMVYPISRKSTYEPPKVEQNGFTASMNSTLDQMKSRY